MKAYAIIVAGGKGLRMGGDIPKQFLPIAGKPILMHTIEAFRKAIDGIQIVLVLPVEQQDYWKELCKKHGFHSPELIANGGETRFHSVKNGLALLPDDKEAVVGVHDGVRPFVSKETITRCFTEAAKGKAIVPVVPVVETIRQILPEGKSITRARDEYRLVQSLLVDQILFPCHEARELTAFAHLTDTVFRETLDKFSRFFNCKYSSHSFSSLKFHCCFFSLFFCMSDVDPNGITKPTAAHLRICIS